MTNIPTAIAAELNTLGDVEELIAMTKMLGGDADTPIHLPLGKSRTTLGFNLGMTQPENGDSE